jgi:hypothetical protein
LLARPAILVSTVPINPVRCPPAVSAASRR